MKLLGVIALVLGTLWVLAATVIPTGGRPRFLPRVWDLVARRRMVVVAILVVLLAVPFANHEWYIWHLHPTCTTANIAVDFGPGAYEDRSTERWADMSRKAQEGCPPGQWDRSKVDLTKI